MNINNNINSLNGGKNCGGNSITNNNNDNDTNAAAAVASATTTITSNKNKNQQNKSIKSYPQIVRLRIEQSLYYPYYYPISADSLNIHGPIMIVYNRPTITTTTKLCQRINSGGNITTHNWNLIESIEQETNRSGTTGTLVLEPKFSVSISDSINNNHQNDLIITQDSQATVPTSMLKLIHKLRTLFPNVPM